MSVKLLPSSYKSQETHQCTHASEGCRHIVVINSMAEHSLVLIFGIVDIWVLVSFQSLVTSVVQIPCSALLSVAVVNHSD